MQSSPSRPYVVTIVPDTPAEATEMTVGDVLISSVSMAGLMLIAALVLGVVLAGVRVVVRRLSPPVADHMPQIRPSAEESSRPPSSPLR